MAFVVRNSGMSMTEAWQVTFAEFWPLFHQVMNTASKPRRMTGKELRKLQDEFNGVKDGNA